MEQVVQVDRLDEEKNGKWLYVLWNVAGSCSGANRFKVTKSLLWTLVLVRF